MDPANIQEEAGGPAFPQTVDLGDGRHVSAFGASLRDYFAAKAMQGIIGHDGTSIEGVVEFAYRFADAMLKERIKEQLK